MFQRQTISDALSLANGNWAEVARQLHVDRGNLHRLAKRLGLKWSGAQRRRLRMTGPRVVREAWC